MRLGSGRSQALRWNVSLTENQADRRGRSTVVYRMEPPEPVTVCYACYLRQALDTRGAHTVHVAYRPGALICKAGD